MSKRIYIDSCVLISYLLNEGGRADTIEAALRRGQGKNPSLSFVTSALAISELAYLTDVPNALEASVTAIDIFWDSAPIKHVEINRVNATQGRDLLRERARVHKGKNLPKTRSRASDALHLASAISLQCKEFWTYDVEDFEKYDAKTIKICEPYTDQLGLPFAEISQDGT